MKWQKLFVTLTKKWEEKHDFKQWCYLRLWNDWSGTLLADSFGLDNEIEDVEIFTFHSKKDLIDKLNKWAEEEGLLEEQPSEISTGSTEEN